MSLDRVVVVGGGVMGNGIAQVVAQAGLQVTLVDVDEAALERAVTRIEKSLARFAKSERLSAEESDAARSRISTTADLDEAGAAADHVIETVVEDVDVKSGMLARLDASQFSLGRSTPRTSPAWTRPCGLRTLVAARRLGCKAGRGVRFTGEAQVSVAVDVADAVATSRSTIRRHR